MSKRFAILLSAVLLLPVIVAVAAVAVLLVDRGAGGGQLTRELRGQIGEPEGGRLRQQHVLPAGFVGWVSAHYEVPQAPPLREEDGSLVHEYSDDGILETSSPPPRPGRREFFYRDGSDLQPLGNARTGGARMIWGDYSQRVTVNDDNDTETVRSSIFGFFVGDREQYREAPPAPAVHPILPAIPPLPPGGPHASDR